jgi:hypothetical protein
MQSHLSDAPFARPNGASPRPLGKGPPRTFGVRTNGGARRHPSTVIGSIGSRLRLVLRQPGLARAVGAVDASDLPEVEFVAYSTSERLSGRIRLDAARLTDMLNAHREYVLVDALAERLPEGGSMVVPEILIRRHELALVRVGGPRGDRSLRIPTAKHRLVLRSGRYLIAGRLHHNHGEDPLAALRRREPMVPLTDASIMFRVRVDIVEEPAGTVVVNRDLVEWVREGELDARTFDLPA